MVVDSQKWYANWNNSLSELRKMWTAGTSYQRNLHTLIMVDCSSSMDSSDYSHSSLKIGYKGVTAENIDKISINSPSDVESYCINSCKRFDICDGIINNKGSNDAVSIITFSNGVKSNSGLSINTSYLRNALGKNLKKIGGTAYMNSALSTALSCIRTDTTDLYRLVVITDNNITFSSISSDDFPSNVIFNIVNLGSRAIGNNIEAVAQATGGDVYNAINASDLTYETGGIITSPEKFVGTDSDGDGIPDIVELYGLKPNGEPINTDPNKKDTDGDGIDDNVELGYIGDGLESDVTIADYVRALKVHSDPAKADSDEDGLNDNLDNEPLNGDVHSFVIYETEVDEEYLHLVNTYDGDDDRRPEDFRYADLTEDKLREMEHIYWGDFWNRNYFENWKRLTKLTSMGDMQDVAIEMMEHFVDGTGTDFHSDILDGNVSSHKNTKIYTDAIDSVLSSILSNTNGDLYSLKYDRSDRYSSLMVAKMNEEIASGNKDLYSPNYDDKFTGLGITVDGLTGNKIEVTSFKLEGNHYSGVLHYTMYDIYGLESTDITDAYELCFDFGLLNGFRHWYVLQHWDEFEGQNKPFISYMEFDRHFEGDI